MLHDGQHDRWLPGNLQQLVEELIPIGIMVPANQRSSGVECSYSQGSNMQLAAILNETIRDGVVSLEIGGADVRIEQKAHGAISRRLTWRRWLNKSR